MDLEPHELAAIFPALEGPDFEALKADIAAHGLREPIWTFRGKVIDGRNRARACRELGIEPASREWDGRGSLVEFIVSLNLHRRHLDASRRAACGAEIAERLEQEAAARKATRAGELAKAQPRSGRGTFGPLHRIEARLPQASAGAPRAPQVRDAAAKIVGASPRYLQDAKKIREKSPELHEKVKAGTLTIPQARRIVERAEKLAVLDAKATTAPASDLWRVVAGDCLDVMGGMEPGSARLVFADPPYNNGTDYGRGARADLLPASEYLSWCSGWIEAAARLLADDGSMWVLISKEYADDLAVRLRRDARLHRRDWIIWYESFGVNCSRRFGRCSRHLFHMVKDPKRFVFHEEAVTCRSAREVLYHDPRADPLGKVWDDVWVIPRIVGNAGERMPEFPTQLPTSLLRAIVGCASDPGDLVVDPFSGTGTTSVVATQLGRRSIGIEVNPAYADRSRQRLADVGLDSIDCEAS